MPRKVFVANEILTAGAVNTNLMDQAVMVFADAAARTAALGSPSEGMVTYLEDTDSLELYTTSWGPVSPAITPSDLPAGSVLQVVSTTKTDTFSMSSSTFATITGLTATITPSSTSSKILVSFHTTVGNNSNATAVMFRLARGGTAIALGDSAGSRTRAFFSRVSSVNVNNNQVLAGQFLDSPATTSGTTYALEVRAEVNGRTVYINRGDTDNDLSTWARGVSTLSLMEVAG